MEQFVSVFNEEKKIDSMEALDIAIRRHMLTDVKLPEIVFIENNIVDNAKLRDFLRKSVNLNPYFDMFFEADVTSRLVNAYPYAKFKFTYKYEGQLGAPCFLGVSDPLKMFDKEKLGKLDVIKRNKRKSVRLPLKFLESERTR